MKKNEVPVPKNDFVNPATGRVSITDAFGSTLASLLAKKITVAHPSFDTKSFVRTIQKGVVGQSYTQRIETIADALHTHLPTDYTKALPILMRIFGPENPHETGMFTHFYWLMPIGKYIEKYGIEHFTLSMKAIEELTKRNTGEYAIRPFARKYPERTLRVCRSWAKHKNFHLRRLATEGLRPKLPWAPKLDVWNNNPQPIFDILELLKADEIKFVKKSVANHVRDWLKVNPKRTQKLIASWSRSKNVHTQWILKHAQR
jgi:3-methyladenine DNA glycosylase AlkC